MACGCFATTVRLAQGPANDFAVNVLFHGFSVWSWGTKIYCVRACEHYLHCSYLCVSRFCLLLPLDTSRAEFSGIRRVVFVCSVVFSVVIANDTICSFPCETYVNNVYSSMGYRGWELTDYYF